MRSTSAAIVGTDVLETYEGRPMWEKDAVAKKSQLLWRKIHSLEIYFSRVVCK